MYAIRSYYGYRFQRLRLYRVHRITSYNVCYTKLLRAIRTVVTGEMWIDHETIRKSLCSSEQARCDLNLTKREKQVLNYVCDGASNKEIAQKLYVTEQTVKSHCNKLFKKFGVGNP